MDMLTILRNNVQFVENSGVEVDVDSRYSTVHIYDHGGGEVFLQGDEANAFIDNAKGLWDQLEVISMDEAYKFQAYDYLDLLNN